MLTKRRLLGIAVFMTAPLLLAAEVEIEAVRIGHQDDKTRVAIDLSGLAEHSLFTLSNPHRVVIDIKPGSISASALPLPQGRGAVRRLRSAARENGSVRIVLDLDAPMKPRSFVLAANGERGDRLVIDLVPLGKAGTVKKAPVISVNDGNKGRDIVVAIDPGHGGKDPGARGSSGLREKDVVLKISRRLAEIIDSEAGMRAYLTRRGDQFVPLRDRMERARKAEADLFISIHADSFRDKRVRGATVYVLSPKGASDEAGRRLAARENAVDLIGGVSLGDKDATLAEVLLDLSQNASVSASIDVGNEIISEISQMSKVRKGRVQQAPFLVLKSPDVPSILVETAFISNPSDEKNLGSSRYREQMASAIFHGIEDYFQSNPPAGTRIAMAEKSGIQRSRGGARHVIQRGDTLSTIADRYKVSVRRIRSFNNLSGDKIVVGRTLRIPGTQET
jgi:N-acetylmuramoyl-L-alanine amidase